MNDFIRQTKKLFNAIYSIYALILFFLLAVVGIFFYIVISWLPDRQRLAWAFSYNWLWMKIFCTATGLRIKFEGREHIDPHGAYVIISNHSNMLDIVVTGGGINHPFKPLFKKEFFKIPIMGWVIGVLGLPVDRSSEESRRKSYQQMIDTIQSGISVLIFPEGTRNRSTQPLKPFYNGAFRLAIQSQHPILPIVISGIKELQPVDTFRLYPGTIRVKFLSPMKSTEYQLKESEKFKTEVFVRMEKELISMDLERSQPVSS